jgi:hypothetical protein
MSKARGLADLGNVYSDGALSNRNLIINGAMQVAQRGTSFTDNVFTLDRWKFNEFAAGTRTITQSTDVPVGFSNSLKYVNDATPATSYFFVTKVERKDFERLSGQTLTCSFYVTASVAINNARWALDVNGDNTTSDESSTGTYNITTSWQRVTFNVTLGDFSTYTFTDSGFLSVLPLTSSDTFPTIPANTSIWFTGIQLEVGDTATPFEHRSFAQELALCQRYYERSYDYGTASGTATGNGGATLVGNNYSSGQVLYASQMRFVVAKRTVPTFSFWSHTGVANKWFEGVAGFSEAIHNPPTPYWAGHTGTAFYMNLVGANADNMYGHWAADAEL